MFALTPQKEGEQHAVEAEGHAVFGCARSESGIAKLNTRWGPPHRFDVVDVASDEAVRQWEAQLAPLLSETLRKHRRGRIGTSWYVDETFIKEKGRLVYLYRAIDRDGNLVDVLLSEKRDKAAAQAFFRSARTVTGHIPARVTSDGHARGTRLDPCKKKGLG